MPGYEGRPVMEAVRLIRDESIVLDGRLDEPVWQRARPATDFIQLDPKNGAPATEQTEVRIVFDRNNLYMGVLCLDSEPDKLLGNTMQRDAFLSADDRFNWSFDTLLDGRTGYYFETNPSGAMGDGLIVGSDTATAVVTGFGGSGPREWDGVWNARVRRSQIGWTIEVQISFRTFNFNPNAPAWGVNFQRTVRRKNEESLWTGWGRNQGVRRPSSFGLLTGIKEVSQGVGLDIRPYAIVKQKEAPARNLSSDWDGDAGVDFFYSLTPVLRANFTVNTDFAETEVDQRLVNLDRFPLFYPEKRAFFLEGAGFFSFSREPNNAVLPFFSRRIGLDERGQPRSIQFGLKLTGQAGRQDLGVLQVRTSSDDTRRDLALPGDDFTVVRVKRRMLRQSYFGGIYTRRSLRTGDNAADLHTAGIDFQLATTRFGGSQNLEFSGFYLRNNTPGKKGEGAAYGLRLDYPNDPWSGSLAYRELQMDYDPAVGFRERNNYRRLNLVTAFGPRPKNHPWIRRVFFQSNLELLADTDGRLVTRKWDITALDASFHTGDGLQIKVVPDRERLERNFTISRGIVLPAGNRYSFTRYSAQLTTTARRMLAVTALYGRGGFFSGDRREFSVNLGIRPRPGIVIAINPIWNRVELKEGKFSTAAWNTSFNVQFNPWISVTNNVQYDSVSRIASWQSRFRWILRPGNDLYFVYLHNWLDNPVLGLSTADRQGTVKFVYTQRF
ncbi:MAG: carbohydrate binding family 9 domain-containing protein [Acidobacteria bacterium]|nr:carbohydrate binding family 9 domain-containing protein [Acidobacteriota bacterium]